MSTGELITLVSILVSSIGVVVGSIRWYISHRFRVLRAENSDLRQQKKELERQLADPIIDKLRGEQKHAVAIAEQWKNHAEQKTAELKETAVTLEQTQASLTRLERLDKARHNRVRRALRLEGLIWKQKVLHGTPRFRPLADRRTAMISVLNLKGGVGKTTLTAYIGTALAQRGYRVLLLDLDLQGSLSSLFIEPDLLAQRAKDNLCVQHLLTSAVQHRKLNLLDYSAPILGDDCGLLATTDRLAYAEQNLNVQWLLRTCQRDVRFLLRRALHQKRVTGRYDIVLIDCPPLINTCCVNALAASDYVLVPVTPSHKAAERVPELLSTLKQLGGVLNPQLGVLGLVANRTYSDKFTAFEADLWSALRDKCQDQAGAPLHCFDTLIRQTSEIRGNEAGGLEPPARGSDLHAMFHRLVREIERRLPSDCRRPAEVPS